jgi:hypothetical protein
MKIDVLIPALILAISALISGCKEEEPYVITCMDGPVTFELLRNQLNPPERLQHLNDKDTITTLIIQAEEQYYNYLNRGEGLPAINFKEKTLLAGRVFSGLVAPIVKQTVDSDCMAKTVTLTLTMKYASTPIAGFTHYYAIVPKISDDTKLKVLVKFIH